MRLPIAIVSFCLVALAAAGWLYAHAAPPSFGGPAGLRIEAERAAFLRQEAPLGRVDWQTTAKAGELVDPAFTRPFTEQLPADGMREVYAYAESCQPRSESSSEPLGVDLAKALTWARYLCGETPAPDDSFFREPPFMHPSGSSYVRLAAQTSKPPFSNPDWLPTHATWLHVHELKSLPEALRTVSSEAKLLAELDRPALAAVVTEQPFIVSGGYFLVFVQRQGEFAAGGEYHVYPLAAWLKFAEHLPFELTLRGSGPPCLYGSGPYCWAASRKTSARWLRVYAATGFSALAVLTLTLSLLLVQRIRAHRLAREAQLFILRSLTHELRTPATTLALALDEMRNDFDLLPEASQRAFLRMCDEAGRLGRVIQGSTRYLKAEAGRGSERFAPETLPSLAAFCEAVLETYLADGQVRLQIMDPDGALRTDPYWLRVCLVNLVENALQHGKAPVDVQASCKGGWVEVRVQDRGELTDVSLAQLTRSFLQRRDGGGLGFGLSIVQQTAKDLGGTLALVPSPTTFVLRLKESP